MESRAKELESEVAAAYQQHAAGLLRYAGSLASNHEEARDAVQETFLRFFVERNYGRAIANPRAWLFQVLRNHLMDRLKTTASQREVASYDLDRMPDQQRGAQELIERREIAQEIASRLSDRELDCLLLRAEGLEYEEIAETMGVRSGTVGALLSRAQHKLRPSGESVSRGLGTLEAIRFLFREARTYSAG